MPLSEADVAGAVIAVHAHRYALTDVVQGTLVLTDSALYFKPSEKEPADEVPFSAIVAADLSSALANEIRLYIVTDEKVIDYRIPPAMAGKILRAIRANERAEALRAQPQSPAPAP